MPVEFDLSEQEGVSKARLYHTFSMEGVCVCARVCMYVRAEYGHSRFVWLVALLVWLVCLLFLAHGKCCRTRKLWSGNWY